MEAPWQDGLCERAVGIWKLMWKAALTDSEVYCVEDVALMTVMLTWAKNNRINESGFPPSQFVLGRSAALPWGLSDGRIHAR